MLLLISGVHFICAITCLVFCLFIFIDPSYLSDYLLASKEEQQAYLYDKQADALASTEWSNAKFWLVNKIPKITRFLDDIGDESLAPLQNQITTLIKEKLGVSNIPSKGTLEDKIVKYRERENSYRSWTEKNNRRRYTTQEKYIENNNNLQSTYRAAKSSSFSSEPNENQKTLRNRAVTNQQESSSYEIKDQKRLLETNSALLKALEHSSLTINSLVQSIDNQRKGILELNQEISKTLKEQKAQQEFKDHNEQEQIELIRTESLEEVERIKSQSSTEIERIKTDSWISLIEDSLTRFWITLLLVWLVKVFLNCFHSSRKMSAFFYQLSDAYQFCAITGSLEPLEKVATIVPPEALADSLIASPLDEIREILREART